MNLDLPSMPCMLESSQFPKSAITKRCLVKRIKDTLLPVNMRKKVGFLEVIEQDLINRAEEWVWSLRSLLKAVPGSGKSSEISLMMVAYYLRELSQRRMSS